MEEALSILQEFRETGLHHAAHKQTNKFPIAVMPAAAAAAANSPKRPLPSPTRSAASVVLKANSAGGGGGGKAPSSPSPGTQSVRISSGPLCIIRGLCKRLERVNGENYRR